MSDRPVSRTAHALLGFLSWGPMAGYDLKRVIDGSIANFWSESFGQIYPMLRALNERGWIRPNDDGEDAPSGPGRKRVEYAITDAGRRALEQWLEETPRIERPRSELLLKLFFGARIAPERSIEHIETARAECLDLLQRYAEIRPALESAIESNPDARFWLLTLRYGERDAEAGLAWCDEAIAELRTMSERAPGSRP